jgi:DNA-binding LacI/PurR family transcriptional regulator
MTIKDLAEYLGVSHTTVSAALSGGRSPIVIGEATRQRVIAAAKKFNYRPNYAAQQLAGKSSGVIALLLTELTVPHHVMILQKVQELAHQHGFILSIGLTLGREEILEKLLCELDSRDVEGILCIGGLVSSWEKIPPHLFKGRDSFFVFYSKPSIPNPCYVDVDRVQGARLGARHLLSRGRKRIGLALSSPLAKSDSARLIGYSQELKAAGLPVDPELVFYSNALLIPPPEAVGRAIDTLVIEKKVDAILANQDYFAVQLISQLKNRGIRVPDDVAIVGFGNITVGTMMETPLTTVDFKMEQVAEPMFNMLLGMIKKGPPPEDERVVIIPPELIVRESS